MDWKTPDNLTKKFIAGCTFNDISDWNVCPRYPQRFDLSRIKEDQILFLNLDYFENFFNYLDGSGFSKKFILLTHNSDRDFTRNMFDRCKKYTKKIYAINCTFTDPIVSKIPIGFNDQSTEILDKIEDLSINKENLIYVNFKLHHHPDRPVCLNNFKDKSWATIEPNIIPMDEFYRKLRTFKFCISPRGTGIDTHRTYESLYFNVIPILKTSEIDDLHAKLPLIIVKDWSEITENYLNEVYEFHYNKLLDWKKNNPDWYLTNYWIK